MVRNRKHKAKGFAAACAHIQTLTSFTSGRCALKQSCSSGRICPNLCVGTWCMTTYDYKCNCCGQLTKCTTQAYSLLEAAGASYSIPGLVEHLNGGDGCADSGHFVAWLRNESGWFRMDGNEASAQTWLRSDVAASTVLAVYTKMAAAGEDDGGRQFLKPTCRCLGMLISLGSLEVSFAAMTHESFRADANVDFDVLVASFYSELKIGPCVEQILSRTGSISAWRTAWRQAHTRKLMSFRACGVQSRFTWHWFTKNAGTRRLVALQHARGLFKAVLSSVLRKNLSVAWGACALRHGYWAVVTSKPCSSIDLADPTDKHLFPGAPENKFHVVHNSNHAAFAARLSRADGYAFLALLEVAATLCPEFPVSGSSSTAAMWTWSVV